MTTRRRLSGLVLGIFTLAACGGHDPGPDPDAAGHDAAPSPDGAPSDAAVDAAVNPDGAVLRDLSCHLAHVVPYTRDATEQVRIRVWMSASDEPVVVTEMDEIRGGQLLRTLPMTSTTAAGDWLHPSFGFDGPALAEETALCDDLPPVDALYFEMRGTVGGQPAGGTCGFGPGSGGWPPRVRAACGESPFVDGAIGSVYQDPVAPPPGATQLFLELRLAGPATDVTLAPLVLSGVSLGQTSSLALDADPWQVLDLRADDPASGPDFDGTVPAEGRAVYLALWGQTTLGADLCAATMPEWPDEPPLLYASGSGTSSSGPFTWTTAGNSCTVSAGDQDHALP